MLQKNEEATLVCTFALPCFEFVAALMKDQTCLGLLNPSTLSCCNKIMFKWYNLNMSDLELPFGCAWKFGILHYAKRL